jgi:hypothetical protein
MPRRQPDRNLPAPQEATLPLRPGQNDGRDWTNFGIVPAEQRPQAMQQLDQRIDERIVAIETNFIGLGRELLIAYNNHIWEHMLDLRSWNEYVLSKQTSPSVASDLMAIHTHLIPAGLTEEQLIRIGLSKVRQIIPLVREGMDPIAVAAIAEAATWRGLQNQIRALRAGNEEGETEGEPLALEEPRVENGAAILLQVHRRNGHLVCTFETDQRTLERLCHRAHFRPQFVTREL